MISTTALATRLGQVATALELRWPAAPLTLEAATELFVGADPGPSASASYLLQAVLCGVIPTPAEVVRQERRWRLDGIAATLAEVLASARRANRWGSPPPVRIAADVLVDVHDTAHTAFTTGIQRVVRSTVPLLVGHSALSLLCWNDGFGAPRTLGSAEQALVLGGALGATTAGREIVVPYRSTFVLPEIAVDERRATRLQSIALYSASRTVAIGFDCIPITTAETAGTGMPGGFARYLSCLAAFDLVAPISEASGVEFSGWRDMLAGAGLAGPTIEVVELPGIPDDEVMPVPEPQLRERLGLGADEVILLAVGSHEPRKNHLALLQAAELVWREGAEFTLVMVGGNSWDTAAFDRALAAARTERGRRILTLSGADDATVWGLYRAARFSLFPSLNEGFGLPIVESVANGTPVVTSDFGSMRELAAGHGGLLVDPRDEESIAGAIRSLLYDAALLAELRAQTKTLPLRRWEDYARELWAAFGGETS